MPWINGRFYGNPLFGRPLEKARLAETGRIWSEGYPELEPQHARQEDIAKAAQGPQSASRKQPDRAQDGQGGRRATDETTKINKIYNEFSGLRPKPGMTTADDLNRARRNAAHVYDNQQGKGFQGRSTLGSKDARDVHIPGTPAARGYQATKDGIVAAAQEPDTTQNANHVYIYDPAAINAGKTPVPGWVIHGQTTTIAGPFINRSGGGDIQRGHEVYIITVNDRNMRHPDR